MMRSDRSHSLMNDAGFVAVKSDVVQESSPRSLIGSALFGAAVLGFLAISVPVLWRGAPLADDFNHCLGPLQVGLSGFLSESWDGFGMVRPARFLEILLTTGVCRALPFGFAIAVPLILTFVVGFLIRGLLRDLGVPAAWADIGGALYLLQPLGTEAGLWPAALHVPLGLSFALLALRLYHRGRTVWASVATGCAILSVEQVILVVPVAAWLSAPMEKRRQSAVSAAAVVVAALGAFALWNGDSVRLQAGVVERLSGLAGDPLFYVTYPAVGMGVHSIPLAVWWAWPASIVLLMCGAIAGALAGRRLPFAATMRRQELLWAIATVGLLVLLANVLVALAVPRYGSPRVFTPTWAILVIAAAAIVPRLPWRRPMLLGACGGAFAAGAMLSLALSSAVRLASADFNEGAAHVLASRTADGAEVAVCEVKRTVLPSAPRGAFAVHELTYARGAQRALEYYTGRRATIHLSGELWDEPCPGDDEVDLVVDFNELVVAAARPGLY